MSSEDLKFHLLANNLCENLKRSHIRLDIDNYSYLKNKIKDAIDIKYNNNNRKTEGRFGVNSMIYN